MTSKQPPRIATWMLKHFGSGPDNDALLGDLAEQYRRRDSAMWYWRQAMKAIPVSLFKEIRGHKGIAARALLMGFGMWLLYIVLIFFPLISRFPLPIEPRDSIGTAWTALSAPVGVQTQLTRLLSLIFAVALPLIVWAVCGWLVARIYRGQQRG